MEISSSRSRYNLDIDDAVAFLHKLNMSSPSDVNYELIRNRIYSVEKSKRSANGPCMIIGCYRGSLEQREQPNFEPNVS